jgi:hypothetical protein
MRPRRIPRRLPRRAEPSCTPPADPVRDLLASLPWTHPSGAPDGCIALLRRAAEERGADLSAVDPWVLDHGGTIASALLGNRPLGRGGDRAGTHEVPYYVVPVAALEGDPAAWGR